MKIESIKERLQNVIGKAEKVSGKNLALPVLKCVLLVAKKNTLSVRSTNLDLGVDFTIPVKVEKEGVVAVPASILNNCIGAIQHKNVTLELIGTSLKISSPNSSTSIKTLPYEDFPLIPALSRETVFTIDPREFLRGLRAVSYSSSVTSIKPELSSVYVYSQDGMLIFAATDSFRLAEKQVVYKDKNEFQPTLIPIKNIPEITRILEDASDPLSVVATKNQIAFFTDDFYLTSRVIEGAFPDYRQIIPKESTTEVTFLKEDALNAFRMATLFSDKSSQINIRVAPKKKLFEIEAKNSDVGESTQSIEAVSSGEDIESRFNHKYLLDCFPSLPTESVSFSFSGAGKPLIVRGKNDRTFTYLVMPMNR